MFICAVCPNKHGLLPRLSVVSFINFCVLYRFGCCMVYFVSYRFASLGLMWHIFTWCSIFFSKTAYNALVYILISSLRLFKVWKVLIWNNTTFGKKRNFDTFLFLFLRIITTLFIIMGKCITRYYVYYLLADLSSNIVFTTNINTAYRCTRNKFITGEQIKKHICQM